MAKKAPPTPVEVIRRRRMNVITRRDYGSLLVKIAVIVLAGWIVFTQVFMFTQCLGMGMFPAIEDGDLVLVYRLQEKYEKGDVVAYTHNGETLLGRIVAKQTDVVNMNDSGTLQINGTNQGGEIMYPTYSKPGTEYPFRVPEETLFLLGDYRTQAEDSRDFGPIPMDDIQGKVITIVRRRGV